MWHLYSLNAEDGDIFIFEMDYFNRFFLPLALAPWRQRCSAVALVITSQNYGFMEPSVQFELDEHEVDGEVEALEETPRLGKGQRLHEGREAE